MRRPIQGLAVFMLAGLTAFGQQYHSNDITPPVASNGMLSGAGSGKQVGGGSSHAYLFSGNALTAVDLHPTNWYASQASAISDDGSQQCGFGYGPGMSGYHPILWNGSNSSYVDLLPSGYMFGYCTGVDNGQQTGLAQNQSYFITAQHALLWNGNSAAVDLHPNDPLYAYSLALGVKAGQQVGFEAQSATFYGTTVSYSTPSHAIMWTGTAASAVDLHPAGFTSSQAQATNGVQQGGWAYNPGTATPLHAILWNGSATNFVDLNPAGYTYSEVNALSSKIQVGDGWVGIPGLPGAARHALAWSGTADTVIDLNQYLPAGYTNAVATGIDANGNVVGYAYNGTPSTSNTPPAGAIAVVFAPGQAPANQLSTLTVDNANPTPGVTVNGTATLGGAAPAGGVTLTFLSTNTTIAAAPASVVIPEGSTSATFSLTIGGTALTVPTSFKVYATDGTVSRSTLLTVTPVVNLSSVSVNSTEGGFTAYGSVSLTIPAQLGGATVTLTSGNTALLTIPASVTVPQGFNSITFTGTTAPVTTLTTVPVSATFNGTTVTANMTLSPAPVVSVSSVTMPSTVGGQAMFGTVILNNFVRDPNGATVSLVSSDATLVQVPATVFIPQYGSSASFSGTTTVVKNVTNVSVVASYNGSSVNGLIAVNPIPTVTITNAQYDPTLQLFKVTATTTFANSILTYGINGGPAIGTMQIELGAYNGSMLMSTAPSSVTVWNSNGGSATSSVAVKSSGGGGGGTATGGGGGGGGTSTTFKISISTTGKGTVTTNPTGTSFAAGTVVTLTATPAAGSPWIGWGGACSGTATTCKLTMNANYSVTANFK